VLSPQLMYDATVHRLTVREKQQLQILSGITHDVEGNSIPSCKA